jgi:hypothetical protein
MLTLKRANRDINGKQYLMECYNTYSELVRNSKLIKDPYMLQKDFLQNVDKSMGVITNIDIPLDESLQDLAAKTMGEVSTPKLKIPLDVETGGPPSQIIQRFSVNAAVNSLEDISSGHYSQHQPPHQSHYPHQPHNQHHPHSYSYHHNQHHQQPQQPRRPSFTNEYDPLYSLSRKSIFGGAPKKSSFLEMAGVDLREPTIEPNTASSHHSYHLTATEENPPIIDSIKSIFSNMAIHSRPASHNNTPDNSHHTHTHSHSDEDQIKPHFEEMITKPVFPRNISQINLIQEKEQISQSPPQSQTSGLLMPPAKQQKEKGVKDIIQEIENKPKKDISTNPHDP